MLNLPPLAGRLMFRMIFLLHRFPFAGLFAFAFAALMIHSGFWAQAEASADDRLPAVRVTNVRRAFDNGEHNAFTDLVRFQGKFYLTFRSCPDGHMVHPTSSIRVLSSTDGIEWQQVHQFRVEKRDTRDPHFLILNDRLLVYSGTWYSGESTLPSSQYDLNLHLGYAVWTTDGQSWTDPILLEGTFGHYIWRATAHAGRAYLCGRRKRDFAVGPRGGDIPVQSLMLESDDGLIWRTRAMFQQTQGDEVAFQLGAEGNVLAVARRGRESAELLRSSPPYSQWQRHDLGRYIGGPLLASWDDRMVVGGRHNVPGAGPRTTLSWLVNDQLHDFAELPSGGDNSYPGFIELGPDKALVSWYSSHEKDASGETITAIYLADLEITE